MRTLAGGCRVSSAEDGEVTRLGTWTSRATIKRSTGALHITQTINAYAQGRSPVLVNPGAEEALYVAAGQGSIFIDGSPHAIQAGTGIFIPPAAEYSIENPHAESLLLVSACCPEDPARHVVEHPRAAAGNPTVLTVRERDREVIRAGKDREFRYLVHRDLGCRQITQFVGWIPPSVAPFHYHTYEEGIFILEGHGVVHVDEESCEFGPGSSIFFPIGVRHCMENPGAMPVRLLGAFYPSGSPGAAYED